ncbi:MAG: PaaI family thioesterase, partial [Defluviicoccus sp.]|nr:PaaI family thioesterase [Defluviicoccus sp.]
MPDDLRARLEAELAKPPFHRWLRPAIESVEAEADALTVRIPARPEFARIPGEPGFHGAIVAGAVDIAAHAAIVIRTRGPTPTVDLRVDYLRASTGADLLARAEIVRAGRSLG